MKKLLFSIVLLLFPIIASAFTVNINGIYYNLSGTSASTYAAEVTYSSANWGGYSGSVTIPSSVTYNNITYPVKTIGSQAFYSCIGLTSVTIPSSVTKIDNNALSYCSGLTSLTIPSSVTEIGYYAFNHCSSLTTITVQSGNTKYDSRNNCNAIIETASNKLIAGCKNTIIPSNIVEIETCAFQDATGLTSVTIPSGVTRIGEGAFWGCTGLTSVEIPNGVTRLESSVFYGCTGLTSVEIPNSVTNIYNYAFKNCSSLSSVIIPNSVETISDLAFGNCTSLTSITIPSSVTTISRGNPFEGCSSLTSISVETGNTYFDSRNDCQAIIRKYDNTLISGCKNSSFPSSVTSIGAGAFVGCSGLASVEIPDNITSIGRRAFEDCTNLTNITIPSGVTSLGDYIFWGCTSLSHMYCKAASVPSTSSGNPFESSNIANATLHVPTGSVSAYQAADYWNEFKEIVEMAGSSDGDDTETSGADNYITIHTNTTGGYAAIGWHLTDSHFLHLESENIDKDYIIAHISKIVIDNIEYKYQGSSLEDYGLDLSVEHTIMVFFDTPLTDIDGLFDNRYNIDVLDMSHFNASCLENMHDCLCGMVSLITWVLPADLNITLCAKRTVTTLDTTTLLHVYCPANRLDDYKSFFINTDTRVYDCLEANNSYYYEGSGTVEQTIDLNTLPNLTIHVSDHEYTECHSLDYYKENASNLVTSGNEILIEPAITNISKIYLDMTKSSTNSYYCYFDIYNDDETKRVGVSSVSNYSTNLNVNDNQNNNIKECADNNTFEWLYYNPENTNEVIIDVKQFFGEYVKADRWQENFLTSFVTKIETSTTNNQFTYNGSAQTPTVTVKDGSTTLTSGTDYTVSYSDNTNAGTATVTITGKGNYTGTKSANFTINKAPLTITANSYTINKGDALTAFTVSYSGFKNGETSNVLTTLPTITCDATDSETAGVFDITPSGAEAQNYDITYVDGTLTIKSTTPPADLAYVDLGLPSGIKWANMNVGANAIEDAGPMYAWGETSSKDDFTVNNYKFGSSASNLTKYNETDGLKVLQAEDDAATVNMGAGWRIPTLEEWNELNDNCTREWTTVNDIYGYRFTGSNGNSIFLPIYIATSWMGGAGAYWTSTLGNNICDAFDIDFDGGSFYIDDSHTEGEISRSWKRNVRAVYDDQTSTQNDEDFGTVADVVDLGLSVKWSSWNIGASSVGDYGGLYGAGDPTGLKTSTSYTDYYWKDGESICGTEYDLAKAKWGEEWRLPTYDELKELRDRCTWQSGEVNGVKGNWLTGPNGNSIFLPCAGYREGNTIKDKDDKGYGFYWSGDMMATSSYSHGYKDLDIYQGGVLKMDGGENYMGQSIRPVYVEKDNDIRDSEGFKYINDFTYIKDMSDYTGSTGNSSFINCSQHEDGNIIKANVFCVENFYGVSEGQSYAGLSVYADKGLTTKLGEFNFCWAFYSVSFYTSSSPCFFFVDAYDTMEIGESKQLAYSDGMVYTFTLLDKIVSNTNSEKKLVFSVDRPLYFGGNDNGSAGIERFSNRVQIKYLANSPREEQSLDLNTLPNLTCGDEAYTLPVQTNEGLTLTWTVEDNAIAEISDGKLIAKAAGETTVTATQAGNDTYLPFKRDFSLTVNNPEQQPAVEVTDISQMDNVIYIEPMEEKTGSQATISLKMKNSAAIRGFQFDLYLPEGVTVVKSSKGKIQGSLSAGRLPDEDEHTLTFSEQADGAIRFLCSSQYDETFTGNDGEIATLKVNIADDMEDGDYPIQLKNMKLTETDISNFYEIALVQTKLTVSSYVVGDINGDDVVDVSDYTGVANHIHGNTPDGFNAKAADVDENGVIDVSDYTGIANIIHTGSIYGNNNASARMLSPRKANTDLNTYDNVMYISPFTASAGTQTTLSIKMKNTAEIRGFQFDLYLPEGMTVVKSNKGRIQGALSAGRLPDEDEHELTFSEQADGAIRFLCSSQYDETFTGNDGEIATLQVDIANSMANGDYPILLKDMKLTETDISKYYTADLIETTVTIGEVDTRTILDETSTTVPEAANNVDVRVLRTIKADEWSTICLPFAMSTAQVKEAFGDDVKIANFTGYEATTDGDDNVTGIKVNFAEVDAIEANHPYVIKVSSAISEFTVDNVDIDPEDEPKVATVVRTKKRWSEMIGTYVANTTIENQMLFLNGNKFWYSNGSTKMKGYRAYFDFYDVLSEVENASAKITFFDGTTEITNVNLRDNVNEDAPRYNLAGQKVSKSYKGIVIQNGVKRVIK